MLASEQIRAARALLRWEQSRLAEAADVSVETVKRLEKLDGQLASTRAGTLDALQKALEAAGVVFLEPGETTPGGSGVRLKVQTSAEDHPKPAGPATNVVGEMDAAIARDRKSRK